MMKVLTVGVKKGDVAWLASFFASAENSHLLDSLDQNEASTLLTVSHDF
jgi:hypothetical protein